MGLVTVTEKDDIGVATTRSINTTLPLAGGGNLSADRTLSVNSATTSTVGVLQLAGDLGGTGAAPAVLKINGVSVTGTPSAGYSIVATGAAAATWQAAGSVEVPNSRTISTTLPLTGGGDLSANRTLGVNDATSSTVGVVSLAGNFAGTAAVPLVDGLTADSITVQNANLTHKGVWSTVGLRIGDATAPTEKLEVVGNAIATGNLTALSGGAAQAVIKPWPSSVGYTSIYLGGKDPTNGNLYSFVANANDLNINSGTNIQFSLNHTTTPLGNWRGIGLRIGDWNAATEKLEVVGSIKYDTTTTAPKLYQADNVTNGAAGQPLLIQSQNATGTTSTGGALTITAGSGTNLPGALLLKRGTNTVLSATSGYSDNSYQCAIYGGPVNGLQLVADAMYFGLNAGGWKGRWNTVGLRIGDGIGATEKLEVTGNIKYDSTVATPKLYQADVTTNGTGGATLTIQAQNATGTSSVGGFLDLKSGTGTTSPGVLRLYTGGTLSFETGGAAGSQYSQLKSGAAGGIYLDADICRFRSSAGVEFANARPAGLRIGDGTAATDKLEVVGRAAIGVGAGKVFIDSLIGSTATFGGIWFGTAAPTGTNAILYSNGTSDVQIQAPASGAVRFAINQVAMARLDGVGLRIGDNTAAGEKLDVLGRSKIGVGAGKVIIDSSMNASSTEGGIWMGTATPTNANYRLRGDANYLYLNGTTATYFSTGVGATIRATIGDNGLRIGDSTLPTDKLEVVGNSSLLGNATIGLAAVTSAHTLRGSVVSTTRTVLADLVVDTTTKDLTVFVDTTAAVRTITLPTPTNGRIVWIKRTAGTNYVSVVPSSGWIEKSNVTSIRLVTYVPVDSNTGIHPYLSLQADGTNWYIMRHFSIELVLT